MKQDYYCREISQNIDGSPLYACNADEENEDKIAKILEIKWKCEIFKFGKLCPIDYYALRNNRLSGVLELKTRSHRDDKYDTVFLNVRKWLALVMGSIGLSVPGIFVVSFENSLRYIDIHKVNAINHKMGGTKKMVKSHTDIEPIIHIPINDMTKLETI